MAEIVRGEARAVGAQTNSAPTLGIDPATGAQWTRDAVSQPAQSGAAVTPSDTTVLVGCRALWVGGAGDVAITGQDDATFTLSAVAAGTLLPVAAKKVRAATTATLIVALA